MTRAIRQLIVASLIGMAWFSSAQGMPHNADNTVRVTSAEEQVLW